MKYVCWSAFIGAAVLLTGCGSGVHSVSGTVTFDGQPVEKGYISFATVEGPGTGGGGSDIVQGKYQLQAAGGKHAVQITSSKMMPLPPGQEGMFGAKEEERQFIPNRYNAATELTAEVPAAGPVIFELKSE